MKLPRNAALTASMLAVSMLLNVTLVSCGAEPTAPQGQTTEILEKLAEVTAKLAAIEAKLDAQGTATAERLDSLEVTVTAAASGATPLPALEAARLDSIMALVNYLAADASSGGWEFCGGLGFNIGGGSVTKGEAEAKARGSLGAWAGTGGFGGAEVVFKREYALELGLEVPLELTGCIPLGGETPPELRPLRGGASMRLANSTLSGTLDGLASQLGITTTKVETALGTLGTVLQSPASLNLQDAVTLLPLPTSLSSKLADPVATITSEASARAAEAVTLLCSTSWGGNFSAAVTSACSSISSGSVTVGGLVTVMEQFPAVQTTLTSVSSVVDGVCTRVNTIGNRVLTIPNPLEIGPTNLYGPTRLFPSYANVSC